MDIDKNLDQLDLTKKNSVACVWVIDIKPSVILNLKNLEILISHG